MKEKFVFNIPKFGTDKEHNILYITGSIGAGKSILAETYSGVLNPDFPTKVIHMDSYFDTPIEPMCYEFTEFLKKRLNLGESFRPLSEGDLIIFLNAVEDFARIYFISKDFGTRIIVEGLQLADDRIPYERYFKDKPITILYGNVFVNAFRATKRNYGKVSLKNYISTLKLALEWNNSIKKLIKHLEETNGSQNNA